MLRSMIFLLLIGVALLNVKNTSALPANTRNFTATRFTGAPTSICPAPTCKCGDVVHFTFCIDDSYCEKVSSQFDVACCHVSCNSNEKYCVRMIESPSCANKKYDIYIAVDGSLSIKHRMFEDIKKVIMDLLVLLKSAGSSNINIGLMQFSEVAKTREQLPLGNYSLSHVQAVVEQMEFHDGKETMLGNALMRIEEVFNGSGEDRPEAKNKLLIFSDGGAQDLHKAKSGAKKMKEQGVEVITVSVGGCKTALTEMASKLNLAMELEPTRLTDSAQYAERINSLICRSD